MSTERDKRQGQAQVDSIVEMVAGLNSDDPHEYDEALTRIHEDPLSVEIVHGFEILLCTGGPACRIVGTLDEYGEPETARVEYQDWFKPWTELPLDLDELEAVLTYCRQFYFEPVQ